jgi:hypothetical protein
LSRLAGPFSEIARAGRLDDVRPRQRVEFCKGKYLMVWIFYYELLKNWLSEITVGFWNILDLMFDFFSFKDINDNED